MFDYIILLLVAYDKTTKVFLDHAIPFKACDNRVKSGSNHVETFSISRCNCFNRDNKYWSFKNLVKLRINFYC